MTAPSIHVSLIALGVKNLEAAATFYEGMELGSGKEPKRQAAWPLRDNGAMDLSPPAKS
jgi:hypothetical protein